MYGVFKIELQCPQSNSVRILLTKPNSGTKVLEFLRHSARPAVSSLLKTSEVTFKRAQITLGRLLLPGQCKDVISADCFQSRTSSVESHPEQYRADKGSERCTLGRQIGGLSIGATCSPVPPDLWGEESAARVAAWQCFTAAPHSAWRSDAINRVQC